MFEDENQEQNAMSPPEIDVDPTSMHIRQTQIESNTKQSISGESSALSFEDKELILNLKNQLKQMRKQKRSGNVSRQMKFDSQVNQDQLSDDKLNDVNDVNVKIFNMGNSEEQSQLNQQLFEQTQQIVLPEPVSALLQRFQSSDVQNYEAEKSRSIQYVYPSSGHQTRFQEEEQNQEDIYNLQVINQIDKEEGPLTGAFTSPVFFSTDGGNQLKNKLGLGNSSVHREQQNQSSSEILKAKQLDVILHEPAIILASPLEYKAVFSELVKTKSNLKIDNNTLAAIVDGSKQQNHNFYSKTDVDLISLQSSKEYKHYSNSYSQSSQYSQQHGYVYGPEEIGAHREAQNIGSQIEHFDLESVLINTCNMPFTILNFSQQYQTSNFLEALDQFDNKTSLEPLKVKNLIELPDPAVIDQKLYHQAYDANLKQEFKILFQKKFLYGEILMQKLMSKNLEDKDKIKLGQDVIQKNYLEKCLADTFQQIERLQKGKRSHKIKILREGASRQLDVIDLNFLYCRREEQVVTDLKQKIQNVGQGISGNKSSPDGLNLSYLFKNKFLELQQVKQAKIKIQERIQNHFYRQMNNMLIMNKTEALNQATACAIRLGQNKYQKHKIKNENLNDLKKSWQSINRRIKYEDTEWHKNINIETFIEIIDVDLLEQVNNYEVTLFDVMSQASFLGIYDLFDWAVIQECIQLVQINFKKQRTQKEETFYKQAEWIIQQIQIEHSQGLWSKTSSVIPFGYIDSIHTKLECMGRIQHLTFSHKIGYLTRQQHHRIVHIFFDSDSKFSDDVENFKWKNNNNILEDKLRNVKQINETMQLPTKWCLQRACYFSDKNDKSSCLNCLFETKTRSIFMMLQNPENDLQIHIVVDNLKHAFKSIKRQSLGKKSEKRLIVMSIQDIINTKELAKKPIRRTQSSQAIDKESYLVHLQANMKMKAYDPKSEQLETNSCQDQIGAHAYTDLQLKRQGALNVHNIEFCEFLILQKLQGYVTATKDKRNIFYKRLERLNIEHEEAQGSASLSRFFGYKCKMVRDIKNKSQVYECYFPAELSKDNLQLYKVDKFRPKIAQEFPQKFVKMQQPEDEKYITSNFSSSTFKVTKDQEIFEKSKLMKAIMVEDIETDDSMKDIDYDDFKSINDETNEEMNNNARNNKNKKLNGKQTNKNLNETKVKVEKLMINTKTPMEHYHNLKINKKDNLDNVRPQRSFMKQSNAKKSYKLLNRNEIDDINENNNPFQIMRNKIKIERLSKNTQDEVFTDQIYHLRQLKNKSKHLKITKTKALERLQTRNDFIEGLHEQFKNSHLLKKGDDLQIGYQIMDKAESLEKTKNYIKLNVLQEQINLQIGDFLQNHMKSSEITRLQTQEFQLAVEDDTESEKQEKLESKLKEMVKKEASKNEQIEWDKKFKEQQNEIELEILMGNYDPNQKLIINNSKLQELRQMKKAQEKDLLVESYVEEEQKTPQILDVGPQISQIIKFRKSLKNINPNIEEDINEMKIFDIQYNENDKMILGNEMQIVRNLSLQKKTEINIILAKKQKREKFFRDMTQEVDRNTLILKKQEKEVITPKEKRNDNKINDKLNLIYKNKTQIKDPAKITIQQCAKEADQAEASDLILQAVSNINFGMLKDIWSRFPHLSNDIRDQKRMTPMHISAQNGDKESLVFLLNVGMDIDAMDDENNTPLHYAVAGRFKQGIQLLTEHHCNESIENIHGRNAWAMAD